jgi:hypothetical protein
VQNQCIEVHYKAAHLVLCSVPEVLVTFGYTS